MLLRPWRDSDREPFAEMNSDRQVMEFMPGLLSREESDRLIDRIQVHFERHGFGLFAAELRGNRIFLGFVGLSVPGFDAPFMPAVEIGWRLASEHWGQGLATEGAREVLRFAYQELGLTEVVSFTVPENVRSRRVMEKLGMTHDAVDDFDHPLPPEEHALRRQVLYRLKREDWSPAE
jgi:RimJ/RimL family protein N-acetyltransferase